MDEQNSNLQTSDDSNDFLETRHLKECGVFGKICNSLKAIGSFVSSVHLQICDASWIFFMILAITYGPVVFESERHRQIQIWEAQKKSQDESSH